MTASVGTITLFALAIGGWMFWRRKAPKTCILLFLVAGLGIGGLVASLAARGVNAAVGLVGSASSRLIGIGGGAVAAALAVVLVLEVVVMGVWPKKAKPQRYHPWLALALPTVIAAASIPLLTEILGAIEQAAAGVGSVLG